MNVRPRKHVDGIFPEESRFYDSPCSSHSSCAGVFHGDTVADDDARRMISESLEYYHDFLKRRGFEFQCIKLDILIRRVADADLVTEGPTNIRGRH